MEFPIKVNYKHTNNAYEAQQWLNSLPDLFAADFETASMYTDARKNIIKFQLDNFNLTPEKRRVLLQQLTSDGLSHPSLTVITHLSVGWSDKDSCVIVCDTPNIRQLVFNFLTTTDKTQLWHNSVFDFKHIFSNTNKLPKKYIDTQLLAKSILNDANSFRDKTGLKELMAYAYGDWAISKDSFTLEDMYDETMIRYAATDSCATFKLYTDIMQDLDTWKI
jgi:hypothetical protein